MELKCPNCDEQFESDDEGAIYCPKCRPPEPTGEVPPVDSNSIQIHADLRAAGFENCNPGYVGLAIQRLARTEIDIIVAVIDTRRYGIKRKFEALHLEFIFKFVPRNRYGKPSAKRGLKILKHLAIEAGVPPRQVS